MIRIRWFRFNFTSVCLYFGAKLLFFRSMRSHTIYNLHKKVADGKIRIFDSNAVAARTHTFVCIHPCCGYERGGSRTCVCALCAIKRSYTCAEDIVIATIRAIVCARELSYYLLFSVRGSLKAARCLVPCKFITQT